MTTVQLGGGRVADVDAFGGIVAVWETVRPRTLRVGDVTPAGEITGLEYFGEVGVTVTLADGRSFHRGLADLVSRRVLS